MRCSQCGLPLSPTRSSCPRCGTPASANMSNSAKGESNPRSIQPFASSNPPISTEAANMYAPPVANWNGFDNVQNPNSPNAAPVTQMPFSDQQPFQVPFSSGEGWQNAPSPEFNQPVSRQASQQPAQPDFYPINNSYPGLGQSFTNKPNTAARNKSKTTRIGFTVAGLCIVAGSFLLVFIYLIEQGFLPGGSTSTTSITISQSTTTASVKQTPGPTIPEITPTPTFPAQGALDTSVLANNFDSQTGQIIPQPNDDFKVNAKIFVVLSLKPTSTSRAVCLNWYLNGQSVNTYPFAVEPASNYKYYSYAIMQTTGSGYLEISVASTVACTDALLAQKLPFTVSS